MATGEHNEYVREGTVGLLFVEPQGPPSEEPVVDSLTRRMAAALGRASFPGNGMAYRGVHRCSCGATSGNRDLYVDGRFSTNSLAAHYLAWHRNEVPHAELAKVASLVGEAEPTPADLAAPVRAASEEPSKPVWGHGLLYGWLRRAMRGPR